MKHTKDLRKSESKSLDFRTWETETSSPSLVVLTVAKIDFGLLNTDSWMKQYTLNTVQNLKPGEGMWMASFFWAILTEEAFFFKWW